ncbi:MAG TPA: MFS transporter [Mycobacteriales bacterium]
MTVPETITAPVPAPEQAPRAARRGHRAGGLTLAVIAASQLMVVLDATIVNVALPSIQDALHFSTTNLSWVLNAYALTFGGLLLLGGRAGDILGRRRVFMFGIGLFTAASFLGGLATSSGWLLAARAAQGVGAAIASPTALALITTNFAEGPERNRAFGVFAAVSGSGAAIGLLAGGMLTSWLSWRWVLFVNVPIGVLLVALVPLYVNDSPRRAGRFDLTGAFTSTVGMTALVYGFIRAAQDGWHNTVAISSFVAAVVLLAAFAVIEQRTRQPITPLRMFANRDRSGSYAIMLCLSAALFSIFFFLTLFVQDVLHFSPLRTGLAFLPLSAAIILSAQLSARGLPRFGAKPFMVTGAALATVAIEWLTRISVDTSFVGGIFGPSLLFGLGMGFLFVPLTLVALSGVQPHESGAASGLLNVMQQVGGSLGLSIMVTVFGTASRNEAKDQVGQFLADASPQDLAQFQQTQQLPPEYASHVLTHGVSTAMEMGAVFALLALLLSLVVIQVRAADLRAPAMPDMGG